MVLLQTSGAAGVPMRRSACISGNQAGNDCRNPGETLPLCDRILKGMLAVGLVQQAICIYLGLSAEELLAAVVRLGLPTPSDAPMRRRGGKNPWSDWQCEILVRRWGENIHPQSIAEEIGRSAGAVRAKARRLGLFRRNRKDLIKRGPGEVNAQPKSGTEASVSVPLFVDDSMARQSVSRNCHRPRLRARRIVWNDDMDLEVARRWFAWQCRFGIAKDLGLTEGQVRSRANQMGLPARDREKIVPDYVAGRPYDTSLEKSVVRRRCHEGRMYFWGPRNGPHTSPKIMKTRKYQQLRSGLGEAWLRI